MFLISGCIRSNIFSRHRRSEPPPKLYHPSYPGRQVTILSPAPASYPSGQVTFPRRPEPANYLPDKHPPAPVKYAAEYDPSLPHPTQYHEFLKNSKDMYMQENYYGEWGFDSRVNWEGYTIPGDLIHSVIRDPL